MKKELEKFDNCLQHEVSFCSAACPYNLDVSTFISRIQEGRFNAAYKTYRDATGFPAIAAEICTEKCRGACLQNAVSSGISDADSSDSAKQLTRPDGPGSAGDPIELLQLERACLEYSSRKDPVSYNIPAKNRSIAIIGGGISGMACALRMATKKYRVTVFEMTDRIGGHLLDTIPAVVETDFALQMQNIDYEIKFNYEVSSIEEVIELGYKENAEAAERLKAQSAVASVMRSSTTNSAHTFDGTYDAIYIATGSKGSTFGFDLDSADMDRSTDDNAFSATDAGAAKRAGASEYGGPCAIYEGRVNASGNADQVAVFFGGSLTGADSAQALADGLRIASAIDNYILGGVLKYPQYPGTDISIDETQHVTTKAVQPVGIYTKDEAVAEAKRCMKCQCNACRLHCDLTEYVHKWPLRLRDEIIATTAPGKSELHATPAVRLINSCTHCGLCNDTCPADIDMDALIQKARIRMHQLDKMPWAFNDFFLRDMAFTMGDEAHLCACSSDTARSIHISGNADTDCIPDSAGIFAVPCRYAYFPGCQLGASSPDTVLKSYEYLKAHEPSTGIILNCCGIPALWAGDEELHEKVLQSIRDDWTALGKPVVILACPTCSNNFSRYLPEIETVFIYDLMVKWGLEGTPALCKGNAFPCRHASDGAELNPAEDETVYSVFDPCATREGDQVRQSVRELCGQLGIRTEPLPVQEKWSACCSYGGHGAIADPIFADFVRKSRVEESPNPYITYCINCRDSFMHEGKTAPHILNLIFGIEPALDTWTMRRNNRTWIKKKLMNQLYNNENPADCSSSIGDSPCGHRDGCSIGTESNDGVIRLQMTDEMRQKLSDEYILESEVAQVVEFCQRTGRTLLNTETDTCTGYHKIGHMTYWVEYSATDEPNTFRLVNAYTHRMTIDLEMVWNGKKVEIDV